MPLDPDQLDPDPLVELARWIGDAEQAGHGLATSFALATADADGRPSVRMVLLRGIAHDGLRFYTNRDSAKGRDLAANPRAAAVFWWERTNRQVRAQSVRWPLIADDESDAYWDSRPPGHQLAAWASAQSEAIADRAALEAEVANITSRFGGGPIPRPPFWGGYRLMPEVVELWESREDRLHDRLEYRRRPDGAWDWRRLQP